jgi:cytochrome P450
MSSTVKKLTNNPPAWPILGHTHLFIRDKLEFLTQCQQKYGDAVRLKIGEPVWLLNKPADIQHILASNGRNYEKSPKLTSSRGRKLSGSWLLTATGEDHLPLRRQLQPLFRKPVVEGQGNMIAGLADRWISRWKSGDEVDFLAEMLALSQQVMIKALFGPDFEDNEGRFAAAVTTRRQYIEYFFTSNLPVPEYLPMPIVWRFSRARRYLHSVIGEEIRKRRKEQSEPKAYLSMLVSGRGRGNYALDDREVLDEAITITSTGYETIGAALAWTIHLLARHPDELIRIRQDISGLAKNGPVDIALLNSARSLEKVFNESLRLYPPTWIFVRVANNDDLLPGGTEIAAGDKIYICPWTMHRNSSHYPEPGKFDPRRFEQTEIANRHRFSFIPFGGGTKQCIGEPLARLEALIVLSRLIQHFDFKHCSSDEIKPRPSIVLEPHGGLPMRLLKADG